MRDGNPKGARFRILILQDRVCLAGGGDGGILGRRVDGMVDF